MNGTIWIDKMQLGASSILSQIFAIAGQNIRGQVLTLHPTVLVLQKGVLRYDDMQIDIGQNPVNFRGSIGLDETLNMTIVLPYTLEGRLVRVGQVQAADRIAVPLTGTLSKPKLDLQKLVELQLKGQIQRGLGELSRNAEVVPAQADSGVGTGFLAPASRIACRTMKYRPKPSIAAAQTASTICCPVGPKSTEPLKLAQDRTVSQIRSQDQCTRAMSPKAQSPKVVSRRGNQGQAHGGPPDEEIGIAGGQENAGRQRAASVSAAPCSAPEPPSPWNI